jgi:hypothetical protein
MEKPAASAAISSEGVAIPGRNGSFDCRTRSVTSAEKPGLTRKRAPISSAAETWSRRVTVPRPTTASGTSAIMARAAARAASVRSVTSMIGRPPATRARANGTAVAASSMVMIGMTGAKPAMSRMFMQDRRRVGVASFPQH